jgi:hypothetical protein
VRLALKVVLATVLGTLAVLVVFGYLRMRRELALFDSDIRHDHALIGTTLALCVASTWSTAGAERALGLVEQANADRESLTIRWVYPDNSLLAIGEHRPHFPLGALEHVESRVQTLPSEEADREVLVTHVPVRDKGALIGAIEIAESLLVREAYLRSSIWSTVFVTASMVLVSGAVVLVFVLTDLNMPSIDDPAHGRARDPHPWTARERTLGNVRELRNCMERIVALAPSQRIDTSDLPPKVRDYRSGHVLVAGDHPDELQSLEEVERRYILRVVDACKGNKSQAARVLGIGRKTLYRRLVSFGVSVSEHDG